MAKIKGRMYVCNRCGAQAFGRLKYESEDEGQVYEAPEKWLTGAENYSDIQRALIGGLAFDTDYCPKCREKLEEITLRVINLREELLNGEKEKEETT